MNRLTIIGNLVRDPELRHTRDGVAVCSFTVAVNRPRRQDQQQEAADFFRVSAWRALGENCAKWLIKGKKVAVVGAVSVSTYQGNDGKTYANLEVQAQDVEFLSPAGQALDEAQASRQAAPQVDQQTGFAVAADDGELPF